MGEWQTQSEGEFLVGCCTVSVEVIATAASDRAETAGQWFTPNRKV